jgi:hypothetical protein
MLAVLILSGCGGGGSGSASGGSDGDGLGGSSSGSSSSSSSGSSGSSGGSSSGNVVAVSVNAGPAGANGGAFNIPYASVKVCVPGTSSCATINDVLVDTGSSGLRLMASALAAAGLTLPEFKDPGNGANAIAECLPFADGYTWGTLAKADVRLAGELASDVSINIIDDDSSFVPDAPDSCTSAGKSLDSVKAFSANGVLGVGIADQDCGGACADCNTGNINCTSANDIYFTCNTTTGSCIYTAVALNNQVRNPVALFAVDNNGVLLQLQAISSNGAIAGSGSLVFGIGTQANNALGAATVLTTSFAGDITTSFNGHALSGAFFDSGSNGLYFSDSSIPNCPGSSGSSAAAFYCPSSTLELSASNAGMNGNSSAVTFQIADLDRIDSGDYAIDDVGGNGGGGTQLGSSYFDWGLPFFYGRSVFTAIEGATAGGQTGPFYAY